MITEHQLASLARALILVEASRRAGLDGLPGDIAHGIHYLGEVFDAYLGLEEGDADVLKVAGEVFDARFQYALDRLVVLGLVELHSVAFRAGADGKRRISCVYGAPTQRAESVVALLKRLPDEGSRYEMYRELCLAVRSSTGLQNRRAFAEDATYASVGISAGNLVPLHGVTTSRTVQITEKIRELAASRVQLAKSEAMQAYLYQLGQILTDDSVTTK